MLVEPIQLFCQETNDITILRVGVKQSYSMELKQQDFKAAFTIWNNMYTKGLKENYNVDVDLQFSLYEDLNSLETDLLNDKIDLIGLPIHEYFELSSADRFETVLTGISSDSKYEQFVLLVHEDSGIEDIEDAEGEKVFISSDPLSELMKIWLEVFLHKNGLPNSENFFSSLSAVEKESMAIYSLFFNKRDCALIKKTSFDITGELNPQIKSKLKVISLSPEFILNVVAIKKGYDNKVKQFYINLSTGLHLVPEHKQVLDLFKMKEIVTINEDELLNVKELFKEFRSLNKLTLDKK